MSRILVFANQKGGVGKTTLTMNLAGAFSKWGTSVVVIDADLQRSSTVWKAQDRELINKHDFRVIDLSNSFSVLSDLNQLVGAYDLILVDTPPSAELTITNSILSISDYLFIPVAPSPVDVWSSLRTVIETYEKAKIDNEHLKFSFIVNQYLPGTKLSGEMIKALEAYNENIDILEPYIHQRVAYRKAATIGATVHSLSKHAGKAIYEIDTLAANIARRLQEE